MNQTDMTALVSAFARAYHAKVIETKIFDDSLALPLLGKDYSSIAHSMKDGASFFVPDFAGTEEETLRHIVDTHLSPSPLARSAFAEKALENAVKIGATQYILLGAGYDTFAYRQPDWAKALSIFEVDLPQISQDKQRRIAACAWNRPENLYCIQADLSKANWAAPLFSHPAFNAEAISFCSMLGLTYYLDTDAFIALLRVLAERLPMGSSLVFDYQVEDESGSMDERNAKQVQLALEAGSQMRASYSFVGMEGLLAATGFLAYEHLNAHAIEQTFFRPYNEANPDNPIHALGHTNFCLAVKNAKA